ncbi:porin family protein [Vibrio sp. S9_S30]|uniref:outer membrane beta-barrel protein n=1 Tax=Vibrio sp. S9_S30 TaxID=2720226 RepID=UPI00168007A3|nr:outer membrane beta-barrel protein [Vibrio sp. S9_S30]MBD1557573.1 porin family protein [Vibrio sp. S9_S30]
MKAIWSACVALSFSVAPMVVQGQQYFSLGYASSATKEQGREAGYTLNYGHNYSDTFGGLLVSNEWQLASIGKQRAYTTQSIANNTRLTLPITSNVNLSFLVGINYFLQKSPEDTENKFGFSYGGDLGIQLSDNISIVAGYKIYEAKSNISSVYSEIQYWF